MKARVEKRMAMMRLAGSEIIDEFTDGFNEMVEDESLEDRQNANMLRQMENTMDELAGESTIGFDDFSFDHYREFLQRILNERKAEFENMPNGVFSGFKIENAVGLQPGLIALLGYPAQKKHLDNYSYIAYELIYIDLEGNQISNNQKVIFQNSIGIVIALLCIALKCIFINGKDAKLLTIKYMRT